MADTYQIRVRGHLSSRWAEWFDGLTIENQPNVRVRDLNLPLISVNQIEPGSTSADVSGAGDAEKDALP